MKRWWVWLGAVGVLLVLATGGLFFVVTSELPQIRTLGDYRPPQSTQIFSDDGELIGSLSKERRTVVPFTALPRHVVMAFLAAEDANFYQHEGIDYMGILRAVLKNLRPGAHLQGASTITQQTVKTLVLGPERSYMRKLREVILARELEQVLSKDEILHIYLNQIYFGNGAYGVEAAAQTYFGKSVRQLDLGEGALLAAVPKFPGRYNIKSDPVSAKNRQRYVLEQMVAHGFVDPTTAEAAVSQKVPYPAEAPPYMNSAPHYLEHVRRMLVDKYGEDKVYQGGLTVYTGMQARAQAAATTALRQGIEDLSRKHGYPGSPGRVEANALTTTRQLLHEGYDTLVKARDGYGNPPPAAFGLMWDLAQISPAAMTDAVMARRAMTLLPLETFARGRGLVVDFDVPAQEALVDMGVVVARLPLRNMAWARRFNPRAYTPRPKDPRDVLQLGDLATVEVTEVGVRNGRLTVKVALLPEPSQEGALVALDPHTRLVRAMVGGYRADGVGFNRVTQALRQPGSAFKPVVYAAGLTYGVITPATICSDSPVVITDPWTGNNWKPENFEGGRYDGNITYRTALLRSKNTCSVRLIQKLEPGPVIEIAQAMGITARQPRNLTLALGTGDVTPLELTNAFATIADGGLLANPIFIRRVLEGGNTLEEDRAVSTVALAPPVAYVLTSMMSSVVREGTARRAQVLERPLAGKTGTSQESRNIWFAGFAPQLVATVWMGFDNNDSLGLETGSSSALPAWIRFMGMTLAAEPAPEFVEPEGISHVRINRETGLLDDSENAIEEVFIEGTEPTVRTGTQLRSIFFEDEDAAPPDVP